MDSVIGGIEGVTAGRVASTGGGAPSATVCAAPVTTRCTESEAWVAVALTEATRAADHIASPTGSLGAAPERAPLLDPLSGGVGGSSASGASTSLLFGGLAVLLTAFCLAGPALRRRLPSRPAMSWSAAFVPLLERPG